MFDVPPPLATVTWTVGAAGRYVAISGSSVSRAGSAAVGASFCTAPGGVTVPGGSALPVSTYTNGHPGEREHAPEK